MPSEISDSRLSSSKRSSYSFQLPVRRRGGPMLATQQALHSRSTRDESQLSRGNGFSRLRDPPSQAVLTRQPVVDAKLPGAASVLCTLTLRAVVLSSLRVTAQATRGPQTRYVLTHWKHCFQMSEHQRAVGCETISTKHTLRAQKNNTCVVFQ